MSNDDGHRSRPWRHREAGQPGASDATPTDLAPGKQSLIDRDFGAPVRPGILVQRLGAPPSLVVQTFGITAPFVGPIQQRPAGGADRGAASSEAGPAGDGGIRRHDGSPVQARTAPDGPPGAASEGGVQAAAAQGIVTPSSHLPLRETFLGLFGRRHGSPVQAHTAPEGAPGAASEDRVHAAAAQGIATPSSRLPHSDTIQRLFGRHDISSVQAHTGAEATASARAMHADAYATGNHIVLGDRADLHTAAHEAAHIVQQRGGVQLKGASARRAMNTSAMPMPWQIGWSPASRLRRCSTSWQAAATAVPPFSVHRRCPHRRIAPTRRQGTLPPSRGSRGYSRAPGSRSPSGNFRRRTCSLRMPPAS